MRVDFYQLSRDTIEAVTPLLAEKALQSGARVLIVSDAAAQREALSEALWARNDSFLAHGAAGAPHADRQPILLSARCDAANGAALAILADGAWREEAEAFERAILIFDAAHTEAARALWTRLGESGHTLRIFKQGENGAWREGR